MTKENLDSKNNNDQTQLDDQNSSKRNVDGETEKPTVPLDTFLDVKKSNKSLKEKLKVYEDQKNKEDENKLLEEKKFEEVIVTKDKTIQELTDNLEIEKKNNKLEGIKNKISNKLTGFNPHNIEDALKFIDSNSLLESANIEGDINNRVTNLIESKPYLFKTVTRSKTENNQPANNALNNNPNANKGKIDPVMLSLAQKFT